MLLNNTVHAVNRWFLAPFLTKIQLFSLRLSKRRQATL